MAGISDKGWDLGGYLREQREHARLSVRQLATLAGVSNPYLSQVERGLRKPSAEVLQQIARGLRISAEALYVRAGILDSEGRPDVEAAVNADPDLNDRQRRVLLDIYASFRAENRRVAHVEPPLAPAPDPETAPETTAESIAAAVTDQVAEPMADQVAEPVTDQVTEPAVTRRVTRRSTRARATAADPVADAPPAPEPAPDAGPLHAPRKRAAAAAKRATSRSTRSTRSTRAARAAAAAEGAAEGDPPGEHP